MFSADVTTLSRLHSLSVECLMGFMNINIESQRFYRELVVIYLKVRSQTFPYGDISNHDETPGLWGRD
jgi:hypothetical protein